MKVITQHTEDILVENILVSSDLVMLIDKKGKLCLDYCSGSVWCGRHLVAREGGTGGNYGNYKQGLW